MMPGEKPKNLRATLSRILTYIGKNRRLIIAMLAVMLVATLLNVIAPTIQANAIDSIAKLDANALVTWLVVLGAVYLCSAVFTYFQNLFAAMLSQYTVRVMRKDLFARISRLPIKYMDTHKHGDILSRMTNDVENVSNSVSQSLGSLCHDADSFLAYDDSQHGDYRADAFSYQVPFKVHAEVLPVTAG